MNHWPDVFPAVMTTPLPNAAVNALLGFSIVVLAPILAVGLVQTSVDYEIRTAPAGGGVAQYAVMGSASLLGIVVPATAISTLAAGQTYYLRTRVNTASGSSAWSADTRVTT